MTDSEYRRQLIAIGDAASAEIERYERQLSRIRQALGEQRKRVEKWREKALSASGFRVEECREQAAIIESVILAVERVM